MSKRTLTTYIVVHAADTPADRDVGAAEIRRWHVEERGWADIGYHLVIRRSGAVETGRALDEVGAHVVGSNSRSVGVCLVGGRPAGDFTPGQWSTLESLLRMLTHIYPAAKVRGHRDFPSSGGKTCPTFDAVAWAKAKGLPT